MTSGSTILAVALDAIMVAAGAFAALCLLALLVRRLARVGPTESTCGRCGYIVEGLSTFTCPECGSDLREVGIVRPTKLQRWRSTLLPLLKAAAWPLIIWSVVVLAAALLLTPFIDRNLWPHRRLAMGHIYAIPHSRAYSAINISTTAEAAARGKSRAASAPAHRRLGTLTLHQQFSQSALEMDYLRNVHSYTDAAGAIRQIDGLPTAESVLAFFAAGKLDPADPKVQADAKAIADVLAGAAASRELSIFPPADFPFTITQGSSLQGVEPAVPFIPIAAVVCPVLWGAGVALLLWKQRHRLPASAPSGAPSTRSRTATVMFSDMAGFTTSAASASRDAILGLVHRHRDLVRPIVKRHRGTIVKSLGDALLITFDSATDALIAGLEIQSALRQRNESVFTANERFQLRIAIATGEVTVTDDDVFGHPVNVASHVQQLTAPGAVYFTDSTYHAMNQNEVRWDEVGAVELKGLDSKTNLYRARSLANPAGPTD